MYLIVKQSHITFALISISLFSVRSWWAVSGSQLLQKKWVKITPHVNDTLLLACAIYLMIQSQQYPIAQDWLTVKVIALLCYIGVGTIAIKRAKPWAMVLAIAIFVFMYKVARAHSPWPF